MNIRVPWKYYAFGSGSGPGPLGVRVGHGPDVVGSPRNFVWLFTGMVRVVWGHHHTFSGQCVDCDRFGPVGPFYRYRITARCTRIATKYYTVVHGHA
jgi:hypothetical protein